MFAANELMHSDIVTVPPETTVGAAIDILSSSGVSGLPVVDREKRVLGIITEFAMLAITYDPNVASDPVSRHMTKDVISVDADDRARKSPIYSYFTAFDECSSRRTANSWE